LRLAIGQFFGLAFRLIRAPPQEAVMRSHYHRNLNKCKSQPPHCLAMINECAPTPPLRAIAPSQICKTLYLPLPMKTLLLVAVVLLGLALNAVAADSDKPKAKKPGRVKHMVAFKFKEGTSEADIDKLNAAFRELPEKIEVIRTFDTGTNHSPEKLNKGCTHGYLLTFDSEADRDTYLNHPAHKEFGALAGKMLADVFVLDFTSDHDSGKAKKDKSAKKAEKEKNKDKDDAK
jgi:hypothetical protein